MIVEKVLKYIENIKQKDDKINAFIEIWEEDAINQAKKIEQDIKNGKKPGRLCGYVVSIKDNLLYKGKEITAGSKILKGHISSYTASAVKKVIEEDGVIIGRTNMDEFAMGSSNENSSYFITKNPHNYAYVPGGSSGGCAASVVADFCDVSLGSDTGGSIRQPASFCGVFGLKPTYGTVSRYGLIAFASSLDQIGPIAKNIDDLKLVYDVIKGFDENDSTTYRKIPDIKPKKINEIKIGVMNFDRAMVDKEVLDGFDNSVKKLSDLCSVKNVDFKYLDYAIAAYYIIASSEASSNLARFDGIRYGNYIEGEDLIDSYEKTRGYGFGMEVKRRILLGTYSLSAGYYDAYYLKAQKVRRLIKEEFDKIFSDVDVVICPTTPTSAFRIGEKIKDPISMYMSDIFTVPVNLAGICALNVPCGKNKIGLPYGIELIGNNFCEEYLFEVARYI